LNPRSLFKAGLYVLLLIIVGKVLAFVRDIVISGIYGAGVETDAYFIALNITSIMFVAFYSTVSLVFLPLYNESKIKNSRVETDLFSSNVINLYLFVALCIMVLGGYYSQGIVELITLSPDDELVSLTVKLTRIMVCSFVFSIFISFMASIQISNDKYWTPHLGPVINNFVVIFAVIWLSPKYGIYVPAVAGVFAWMVQAPVHKWWVRKDFNYSFYVNIKDHKVKKMFLLFVPAFLGGFIDQTNILVDTVLASGLHEGSVSALNYSNRLVGFSAGMFVLAIMTIMYPAFSKHIEENEMDQLMRSIQGSIRLVLLLMLPITAIIIVYHYEIVSIVFQRGKFDVMATQSTSSVFFFYAIGLAFLGLRELFNKVFFAMKNTKTPLVISFFAVIINIFLSILLVDDMGVNGLALASSVSLVFYVSLQVVMLYNMIGSGFYKEMSSFFWRVLLAFFIVFCFMYLYKEYNFFNSTYIMFFTGSFLGLVCYVFLLFFFKVEEVVNLNNTLKYKLRASLGRAGL